MKKILHILAGGPAGTGIESIAKSLGLAFSREGLHTFATNEYANVIRGDHSFSSVHISDNEVKSHQLHYDLCIAMDRRTIEEHASEIDNGGAIIFDHEKIKQEGLTIPEGVVMVGIPLSRLAKEAGLALAANVVAVGGLFALLGRNTEKMHSVLKTLFTRKGDEIVEMNMRALELGFAFVQDNFEHRIAFEKTGDQILRSVINGNEAISLGCIQAGLKFLAAYPMTPGSTILTTLAKESRKYDIVVLHVEDEIAAVNMAIGAGYAGVRAATSTSGGGFALMGEAVSLAGQMETPVVIFDAQRPGPSTGLPTRTGQADLRMAIHCGQGDFPRLVLAVGDHQECISLTEKAFHYAEKYQIPVIVLTEKYLADSYKGIEIEDIKSSKTERGKIAESPEAPFPRYADTDDGVSPRSFPGMPGGMHTANSYEHNAFGKIVEDVPQVTVMMEKRWRKIKSLLQDLPEPLVFGESENILVTWGASKNPALAAQEILKEKGILVQIVHCQFLHPFKKEAIAELLKNRKNLIFVEGNQSGQLESLFMEHLGVASDFSYRNFTGRPFTGEEIATAIGEFLEK